VSMIGSNQPFAVPAAGVARNGFMEKVKEDDSSDRSGSMGIGLTEKEIDERISRAVEAEVARRLEEQERRAMGQKLIESRRRESSSVYDISITPQKEQTLPSGVLTPLLKRHKDLDDELKSRLQELERKLERGNKEVQLADVLSPVSKKKTGRAYVALARAHSEKGDLQVALDLYRKAESYVPDNIKLKERIIEIEWAVKNNKPFMPSPKRPRRQRRKKGKAAPAVIDNAAMDVDSENQAPKVNGHRRLRADFGMELTNTNIDGNVKRSLDVIEEEDTVTPPKKQRKETRGVVGESSDEEWIAQTLVEQA